VAIAEEHRRRLGHRGGQGVADLGGAAGREPDPRGEGGAGKRGCAMSFGPGLVAETMMFRMAA